MALIKLKQVASWTRIVIWEIEKALAILLFFDLSAQMIIYIDKIE